MTMMIESIVLYVERRYRSGVTGIYQDCLQFYGTIMNEYTLTMNKL